MCLVYNKIKFLSVVINYLLVSVENCHDDNKLRRQQNAAN